MNHDAIEIDVSKKLQSAPFLGATDRRVAGSLLSFSLLCLFGCGQSVTESVTPPPVEVVVGTPVKKVTVEWDEYVGRLEAVDFVEVRSRVSGYLRSIHFEEGQIVKKDDLLFVIDPRPFKAEVKRADADIAEAKAKVKQTDAQLFEAEANRRSALSRLDLAQKQLKRMESLLPTRAISQDEYDVQAAELSQAQSEVEAASAEIESAKATIVSAQAAVATAEAYLAIAKLNLDYTQILAPVAGRMSREFVTEGNLVSGGTEQSTLLSTIVSLDPIHCYFDADEQAFLKYVRLAREGKRQISREAKNPVYVALADENDSFPHWGHMDFVDNRMDPETGTMRGRAILPNPDQSMVPGLFVRIRLPGSGRYEAILIPDRAISIDQSEKFVFVLEKDNSVRRQVIQTGPIVHGLRVVRDGLNGSEKILLGGVQRVRPGVKVSPKEQAIAIRDDEGLPDDYEPVPQERWLSRSSVGALSPSQPSPNRGESGEASAAPVATDSERK